MLKVVSSNRFHQSVVTVRDKSKTSRMAARIALPLFQSLMYKQRQMDASLPLQEGISYLKIGHFVKVAEKWK